MTDASSDFEQHFPVDTIVAIGIEFSNNRFFEENATIRFIAGDTVQMEIVGSGLPEVPPHAANAQMVITGQDAWCFCRCHAELTAVEGKDIRVRLTGAVEVQQRREFFRWDVALPILYSVPAEQQMTVVRQAWDKTKAERRAAPPPVVRPAKVGFKVFRGRKRKSVNPVRVNLSGSGIRLGTAEKLVPGTLAYIEIFLPIIPARVIIAVGAVIRSTELQLTHHTPLPYLTAFRFEFIDERDRDTIISYLFMEQRSLLRQKADQRADEELPPLELEELE